MLGDLRPESAGRLEVKDAFAAPVVMRTYLMRSLLTDSLPVSPS